MTHPYPGGPVYALAHSAKGLLSTYTTIFVILMTQAKKYLTGTYFLPRFALPTNVGKVTFLLAFIAFRVHGLNFGNEFDNDFDYSDSLHHFSNDDLFDSFEEHNGGLGCM